MIRGIWWLSRTEKLTNPPDGESKPVHILLRATSKSFAALTTPCQPTLTHPRPPLFDRPTDAPCEVHWVHWPAASKMGSYDGVVSRLHRTWRVSRLLKYGSLNSLSHLSVTFPPSTISLAASFACAIRSILATLFSTISSQFPRLGGVGRVDEHQ